MSASGNTVQTASKQPCIRIKLNTYTIIYVVSSQLHKFANLHDRLALFSQGCAVLIIISGVEIREIRRGIYAVRVELPTNILRKTICLDDTLLANKNLKQL